ncbi:hypothetical protein XOC_2871 [Xanthomonas oryzae pv. oryzicola BLS256]|uniref:Uncharacterized protein n=1 Tax=Xanthomonas oryzae pv. oryzicola (strain BLS256) TaxID=383407 RepID=G7TK43_XANOB|nr:hypothetical protein XOC_2871 [Xanthomonas oryzae pv. oryzicola BLS256]
MAALSSRLMEVAPSPLESRWSSFMTVTWVSGSAAEVCSLGRCYFGINLLKYQLSFYSWMHAPCTT